MDVNDFIKLYKNGVCYLKKHPPPSVSSLLLPGTKNIPANAPKTSSVTTSVTTSVPTTQDCAGDLCLVVSAGVVTAERLGVLATALEYRCVMVFFPMCCGEKLLA